MTRRMFLAVLAALALLGASVALLPVPAAAAIFTLVGTSIRSCWESTEGFTAPPDLQPNALPAGNPPGTHFVRLTETSTSQTLVLNTNGTLSTNDTTSTVIRNTTTSRVGVTENTCTGTWTFDAATQRVSTTSNCNFTNTVGGSSTGTVATQSLYRLVGTTLIRIQPATPVLETVNVLTGSGAPFSYDRVCGASATLHLIQ